MAQTTRLQRTGESTAESVVNAIWLGGLLLLGVGCTSGPNSDETGFVSGTWSTVQSIPEPVQEIHAAVLGGHIYIAGGFDATDSPTVSAYRYDPVADVWQQIADLPAARHHMPLVAVSDSLYAVGGLAGGGFGAQSTLWLYDAPNDRWLPRAPLPEPRGASAGAAVNGRVVVVGGYDDSVTLLDSIAIYDPTTNTWSHGPPIPTPRDHLAAVVVNDELFAVGGRLVQGSATLATTEVFDDATGTWSTLASMPTDRGGLGAGIIGTRIHVVGGEPDAEMLRAHEVYDIQTDTWLAADPLPTGRHGLAVAAIGQNLYVIGGGPTAGFAQTAVVEVFRPN